MDSAIYAVSKKSWLSAPTELNYAAMIYSLVARLIERIPTIKDLVKCLKNDIIFKLDADFWFSDNIPSEASYSRLVSRSDVLKNMNDSILLLAITEGFVNDENVAIDACHFETKDQAIAQKKILKSEPKKRGRKKKEDKEQYDQQKLAEEQTKSLYEKPIVDQLDVPLEELRNKILINPV